MTDLHTFSQQQRYQLLAEHANQHAIILLDPAGVIVQWSAGAEGLFGWSAEEILGQEFAVIFTPEDQAVNAHRKEMEIALRERQSTDIRWHLRKDHSRLFADGMLYAIYDAAQNHLGFGKVLREAQAAFGLLLSAKSEEVVAEREFLAAVLDNIEDGVAACNAEGVLTLFNRATREFHGLSEAALTADKWADHYDLYDADGVTLLRKEQIPLYRALAEEEVQQVEMVIAPTQGQRRTVLASGRALHGAGGKKLGAVVSMHDVTTQRESQVAKALAVQELIRREHAEVAADRVRQSEERFRSLVMATSQIVWTTCAGGNVSEESPTWNEFTGQTFDQAKGMGWFNAIHVDDRAKVIAVWTASIAKRNIFESEFRLGRADGVYRWMSARALPILNADGTVREWVGTSTDITEVKQANEALRTSEERLQFALEAGSMAAWDWNLVTGQSIRTDLTNLIPGRSSASASDFFSLVHPDDRKRIARAIEQAKLGAGYDEELRIVRDGKISWVAVKGRLRTDGANGQLHLTGIAMDVTQRRAAEERLKLLDAMTQATRTAADPKTIMTHTTRLLGEHLLATRCAYADLEDNNDQFTIRHDWTTAGAISTVGTYSLDLFGPRAATNLRAGRTLVIRNVDAELDPGEGWEMFSAIGIKAIICCPLAKDGQLLAMMAIHQSDPRDWTRSEITLVEEIVERCWAHIQRVRAADVVQQSQAHLQSIFEQTIAGIVEGDQEGFIINANEAFCHMLGRRREDVIGYRLRQFIHSEDVDRMIAMRKKAFVTGEPFEIEVRYLRLDGSVLWALIAVTPIRTAVDQPIENLLAVMFDITESKLLEEQLRKTANQLQYTLEKAQQDINDRVKAEEALREADKRKDEFLAMLAHELRNPLAPISAAAELFQLGSLSETQIQKTSTIISRQVKHITGLVDDLLDVSRVTRGLVFLETKKLEAQGIVTDAIEQVRPMLEKRGHHLKINMPVVPVCILGDQKRLIQVLTNVLNNAAKYTNNGGQIRLDMNTDEQWVTIIISDNGLGMTAELVARAFDLFAQAERTSDRSQGGLGIGLAMIKSLVELHQGRVAIYSEGLGKGSQVTITLPRSNESVEAIINPSPLKMSSDTPSHGLNILVVDDNVDAAQLLGMFCEALGHSVVIENDPYDALERAKVNVPDICLLDIGLPGLDGNELASRLRAQQETAQVVLVAVTGYGQERDRVNAINAGFDHHFLKPIDTEKLAALLRETCNAVKKTGKTNKKWVSD